ncbi:hypothetical protein BU25DRAFT_393439 [Macroventuria anomochaeta]|uniref:Uncharacterized protein n=1 Tax=Macroventuria anomochaeta TaxID=301207 RepID=A0ACB6S1C2_9PLEO|nr:uncharacterized protein BU25DRAFT_393439 [Macroventuria anomochaeta]KAF2627460.1 hypothetical protein BU25DRAFT_393439 [Macroventuria anomochaeta]
MKPSHDPGQVTNPLDVIKQAAGIGGLTAIPGTAIGAFSGTLRTQTPVLFAIASGVQCFALGSTFWTARTAILNSDGLLNWWNATRGVPLHPRSDLKPTRSEKVRASTIAGAFTGLSLGLLFRGPRNALPGTFMFSIFGYAGQNGYNFLDKKNTEEIEEDARMAARGEKKKNFMERIAEMKWSPMEVLTDERYEEMLQEKLLKLEAEIAIIDDKIEGFRQKAKEIAVKRAQEQAQAQLQVEQPPKA